MMDCYSCIMVCVYALSGSAVAGLLIYGYFKSLAFRRVVVDYISPLLLLFVGIMISVLCKKVLNVNGETVFAFWSTASALMLGLIVNRAQKRLLISQIVNRVSGELLEIYRHLGANLEVLDKIDTEVGVPSLLHIKKLEITKYSSLSDGETLRNIDNKHNQIIFPMTVRVRNYNLNVDILVEHLKSPGRNKAVFNEHLEGIRETTVGLQSKIEECLNKLGVRHKLPDCSAGTTGIIYDKKTW